MHGPRNHYTSNSKTANTAKIWDEVDRRLGYIARRYRRVLILDESGALETLFLLRRGYRPENIHVVNKNPAVVAHVSMRCEKLGFRKPHTHGGDVSKILESLSTRGVALHAVHLDFCGNADRAIILKISECVQHIATGTVLAVTVERAREGWFVMRDSSLDSDNGDIERLALLGYAIMSARSVDGQGNERWTCRHHTVRPVVFKYKGAASPMMTVVASLEGHDQHTLTILRDARNSPPDTADPFIYPCVDAWSHGKVSMEAIRWHAMHGAILDWDKDPPSLELLNSFARAKYGQVSKKARDMLNNPNYVLALQGVHPALRPHPGVIIGRENGRIS